MDRRKGDEGAAKLPVLSKAAKAVLDADYYDVLAVCPRADIIEEKAGRGVGTLRFRQNAVVRYLVDSGTVDLNRLVVDYQNGMFAMDDLMEFYQDLGYSLSGFVEIFGDEIKRRYEKLRADGVVR